MSRSHSLCIVPLLVACFNPDTSHLIITCSAQRPECPEGQACINDRCMPPSAGQPDQGTSDLGPGSADMAFLSGCADGKGFPAGAASACPGTFVVGDARKRCATGWTICKTAAMLDEAACSKLPGFFVADQPAYWRTMQSDEQCSTATFNQMWYGCGSKQTSVRDGVQMCGGLKRALDCKFGSGWTCLAMHSLDKVSNETAEDGVLCCK